VPAGQVLFSAVASSGQTPPARSAATSSCSHAVGQGSSGCRRCTRLTDAEDNGYAAGDRLQFCGQSTITDDHGCKPFSGVGPTRRRTHSLLPQASQDFGESHERENATEGDGLGNPLSGDAIQPRRSVIDLRHAGVTYNAWPDPGQQALDRAPQSGPQASSLRVLRLNCMIPAG
jgi:hypothetical protein